MEAYSDRYEVALALAASAHRNQRRKLGGDPYITHLVHVSVILIRHGFAEDVTIAGLLHDIVEDQGIPLEDIEARFGPAVTEMVAALTEQKSANGVERPWEIRKQEALRHLQEASLEAAAVKAADTLHNARSLMLGLHREGPTTWRRFKRGPSETLWYYRSVSEIVRSRLGTHPLALELETTISRLEQELASTTER
jgi:(p)ppGpp synthase/HD superfamily hydrolase